MDDINKLFGYYGILTGITNGSMFPEPDRNDLGRGFRLVKIEDETINKRPADNYSNLYKDGTKVSDDIFRLGGLSSGFGKNDYCMLLLYDNLPKETWGSTVIINQDGEIVLESQNHFHKMYYHHGVIASMNDFYYNLLTGEKIVPCGSHSTVKSDEFMFVEHGYNFGYDKSDKIFETGVYKIEYATGSFEIFPIASQKPYDFSPKPKTEEQLAKEAEKKAQDEIRAQYANLSRNELCFCGSGLKYKNCHLDKVNDKNYKL